MRLNRFDLNLLVALDALLTEQNTTRAAKRVNLSQPAMSCALARLRGYFNDALLQQVGRRFVPTPLGASLVQPVRELLLRTEATLASRPHFDPVTAQRKFKLMMSDYVSTVLMAEIVKRAEHTAPGISFDVLPHGLAPWDALEKGDVDLLLMPDEFLPTNHSTEVLFEEHYVCVAWAENPLVGDRISREQFLQLGHVIARPGAHPERHATVDETFIENQGHRRRIEAIVGEFSVLPQYVVGSRRIATMHYRLAQLYARYLPLKIVPLPFSCPPIREAAAWPRHRDQDLGLAWVRNLLKTTAEELASSALAESSAAQKRRGRPKTRPAVAA